MLFRCGTAVLHPSVLRAGPFRAALLPGDHTTEVGGPEIPGPTPGYSPRALAMISFAIESGTSLYAWNCIVYVARPCVRERRSVA